MAFSPIGFSYLMTLCPTIVQNGCMCVHVYTTAAGSIACLLDLQGVPRDGASQSE